MLGRDKRTKGGGDDKPSVSPRWISIPLVMGLNPFCFLVFWALITLAWGGVLWSMGVVPTGLRTTSKGRVQPSKLNSSPPLLYLPRWFWFFWEGLWAGWFAY